jgi:hypothetical protein
MFIILRMVDKNIQNKVLISVNVRSVRRLTLIAGILGLVPAAFLGARLFFSQEQPVAWALALLYGTPYLLALWLSRSEDHAARGGLLLTLGLISLAASFSSLAGVALVLLPATAALLLAAALSMRLAGRQMPRIALLFFSSLLMSAVIIGFSVYALVRMSEA